MKKTEAMDMGLCEKACGLYCNKAKKQVCDKFMGFGGVYEYSKYCRLSQSDIEIMKREYNFNPHTNKLKGK